MPCSPRLTLLEIFPSKSGMSSKGEIAGTVKCFSVYLVHAEAPPGEDNGDVRSLYVKVPGPTESRRSDSSKKEKCREH